MFKNTATKLVVFAWTPADGLPKTGDAANLTAYVSKDFGTVTVLADTTATEPDATNSAGYYWFDLAAGETNADTLLFTAKSSTAGVKCICVPAVVYTGVQLGNVAHGGTAATVTAERVVVASTTATQPAVKLTGNSSGAGLQATGGSSSGAGAHFNAGAGGNAPGILSRGVGSGAGIYGEAGVTNAHGIHGAGQGTGAGIAAVGGATGPGMRLTGGATSGDALITGTTSGHGFNVVASGSSKHGINATGGTNGTGLATTGAGTGVGSSSSPDATGFGSGGGASATAIADAVWDEARAGHATAGTYGATSEWATGGGGLTQADVREAVGLATPSLDAQLGALADYIDTEIGAILAAVDTEIGAIKLKTDALPAAPAAVGDAMTLTVGEHDAIAEAMLDLQDGVETGHTPRQALRLMLAALAGKISGATTDTVTIRDVNDVVDRIVASVTPEGDRINVIFDAS